MTFAEFVAERFGGTLTAGEHEPGGDACLHEAVNAYTGRPWSADTAWTVDLTILNDAPWTSDEARTAALLPLGPIVVAWPSWSQEQRRAWAEHVAEQTIRQIVPMALRAVAARQPEHREALEAAAQRCADEGTTSAVRALAATSVKLTPARWAALANSAWFTARSAAWAAASSAELTPARWAAWAARSAAWAAQAAAASAAWAAEEVGTPDEPLATLARIMVEAAA